MTVPEGRSPADVRADAEKKNAEMARQQELAERSRVDEPERLDKRDKTEADSFPASDPPAPP